MDFYVHRKSIDISFLLPNNELYGEGGDLSVITFKKGFTLIELLVTLAILAVISAAVLVAINPVDKLRAANDARVQADIAQVATAINTYAANNNGTYPNSAASGVGATNNIWGTVSTNPSLGFVLSGELSNFPAAPTNYTYNVVGNAGGTAIAIYAPLLSNKYTTGAAGSNAKCSVAGSLYAWWMWNNTTGQACGICTANATTYPAIGAACAWNP